MSQRFEFFVPAATVPPASDELAGICAGLGIVLQPGDGYRPGSWRDAASGASAVVDLGEPPIEPDLQHPPRAYSGWTPLHLAVQLPLVCPHWLAVEGFQLVERMLSALPEARALDCEDIQETPEADPGPFAWSRPRALASWERQHAVQIASRTDLARMNRGDSLRLWRWRREREAAWPAAAVLRDRAAAEAHAVCVWDDPAAPCVLPGMGLVLLRLDRPRLIRRADLPAGEALPRAGAARVPPPAAWPDGLPPERFAACDDDLWVD